MKPRVFVTRKIPEEGLALLRKHCEVVVNPHDRILSKHELIEGIRGKDGLLCLLSDTIDAEVMDASPNLRVIANYAVGFNNIDLDSATARQIPVCNTPDVLTDATADLAMALILAVSRRVVETDKFLREGKFEGWSPLFFLGSDLKNKTLGIIGLGNIGRAVALRAKAFGMKVIYYNLRKVPNAEKLYGAKYKKFDDLLRTSDFVSLHVPLTPLTKYLIGVKELNKMKKSAYLINTSRGPVVDEEALVHALRHNVIRGAALDVFEDEPSLKPGLTQLNNITITPHIGTATEETRQAMAKMSANSILSILNGEKPYNTLNDVCIGKGFTHPFHTADHRVLKNKTQLLEALQHMSDQVYHHHADGFRNDFATWAKDVLKDTSLSKALLSANTKHRAVDVLKKTVSKPAKAVKKTTKKTTKKKITKKKTVKAKPTKVKAVEVKKIKKLTEPLKKVESSYNRPVKRIMSKDVGISKSSTARKRRKKK